MNKKFFTKQFARFRYFVNRISVFFAVANFISLIVIMIGSLGYSLEWYWLLTIYLSFAFFGLIGVYVLEKMGVWQIDWIQTWKMANRELFKMQSEYNAIMIELMKYKTEEDLLTRKQELEESWK